MARWVDVGAWWVVASRREEGGNDFNARGCFELCGGPAVF